jgi:Tol biopolymer transport system component
MKKILPFFIALCCCDGVYAQAVLENNPTGLHWYQVNTPHFRVLFPEGFDAQGIRMANTLEHLHTPESRSLGTKPRKISVVLQNQSSVSNGFVSQFPRRSEFYTMPPQDYNFVGTNDWLNLLASHEYRHIVQYQHATRGFNRLFYYLFGNPTLAGMAQVSAPQWFWEGDAVATETAFTPSGRGKIPNFNLVFRTNLQEGRTFNYHKQYLRSFKHNIPNHYVLGYNMISYLRRKTNDPEIWGKITARSWSVPFIPFAFSNAIKNKTGMYVTDLFREMADSYRKEWEAEVASLTLTPFERIHGRPSRTYTDYAYPQPQEDGSVLVMKSGNSHIAQFVKLKGDEEEKVFTPGFVNDAGMLSTAYDAVVWTEYGYDPRWRARNYSQIKLYDWNRHQRRVIGSKHERYGVAALSPKGDRIVTIRSANDYQVSIVILEIFTGKPLHEFPNPENYFYAMPRWSADGQYLYVIKTTRAGKTLCRIDAETGASEDLLPIRQENLGHPVPMGHYLLFNSPVSGIDNIYALDLRDGKRYQVTSSRYGAYNPAISRDSATLYYNEQSRDGLDVVKTPFTPAAWKPFEEKATKQVYQVLVEQEGHPGLLDSVPTTALPVKRYSRWKGVVNPYAWGLNVTNDLTRIQAGIASQDILSTTSISAGYAYDINERTGFWQAGVSYQGLYPIIDLNFQRGDRNDDERAFGNDIEFDWTETTVEGGLTLPLLLTRSKYSQQLSIGGAVGITKVSSFENTISRQGEVLYKGPARAVPAFDTLLYVYKDQLSNGDLLYNRFSLTYSRLLKTSYRDFNYRWGQTLAAELYNTPGGGDFEGRLWAVRGTLYFPGIGRHHYLYARAAYQESQEGINTELYTFRNRIAKPRGYSYPNNEKFTTLSVNYALPLWYPDIALGPILNIQRIKLNLFYDYGEGTGMEYYYNPDSGRVYRSLTDATYESVGVETTFDFNFMRFLPRFELGFRTTYRKANIYNTSGTVLEFIIGSIGF